MTAAQEDEAQHCYEQAWKLRKEASDLFKRVSESLTMENIGVFERDRYKSLLNDANVALESAEWYDRQRARHERGES